MKYQLTTQQEDNLIAQCAANAASAHKVNPFNEGWWIAQEALEQQVRNIELARRRAAS